MRTALKRYSRGIRFAASVAVNVAIVTGSLLYAAVVFVAEVRNA